MYESPIKVELSDIISDVVKKEDEYILECVQKVGVSVNKDELLEALEFDRGQYEKGWHDRDSEIVKCKDCIHSEEREGFYYCDMLPFQANLIWGGAIQVDDEHFCGYGVRREHDNNN